MPISSSIVVITCLFAVLAVDSADAQSIKLTPQQEAMLNQLPPSQRRQALDALEQINQQNAGQTVKPGTPGEAMQFPGLTEPTGVISGWKA